MPFYTGRLEKFDAFRDMRLLPNGTRFSSYTSVAYPIVRAGWYVTPKVGAHLSQYSTDWTDPALPEATRLGFQGRPRTQARALPIMSVDSGMTFERQTTLFGNDAIQTLEPRLYYLNVPYRDQSNIPVFDTGIATFNFAQAFDENIFSGGWDRIANANQLTVGLTSRWLDEETGFERLSLSAAQRVYFEPQRVTLGGEKPRTNTKSDYLVGANAALTDKLNVRFDAQFNPESRDRNRMSAGFRWEPKRLTTLSASYRYERDPQMILDPGFVPSDPANDRTREQISLAGQWPLTNKVYAMGRYDYSLQEKRNTQSILGLEYKGDCCWTARVVMQRYAVSKEDVNTAVFFQLELSGLGSLGTDPMRLLRERVIGYEPVTPPIPERTTFERYE
jgi:LPS-assembly protein